jgi:hypothetical protein
LPQFSEFRPAERFKETPPQCLIVKDIYWISQVWFDDRLKEKVEFSPRALLGQIFDNPLRRVLNSDTRVLDQWHQGFLSCSKVGWLHVACDKNVLDDF